LLGSLDRRISKSAAQALSKIIGSYINILIKGGAQMTLFSPDAKISILHYRLVWKPTFVLPFGLEAKFHIINTVWSGTGFHIVTVPGGSRRKFGFYSGYFPLFD
jgi:hypothetical protein